MTTYRLWPATSGPANGTADATAYTLGVEFEISAPAVAVPYSSTGLYWSTGPGSAGITNGILTAPRRADAEGLLQGQFNVGAVMTFPANEFNATNYWVDVLVDDGAGPADAGASMMWED